MLANGVKGTGLSAINHSHDLSDLPRELDEIEALGVETIELPIFDMDVVVAAKVRRPQLDRMKRATSGRGVSYSIHGPLAINFMDEDFRLQRHLDVLEASLDVAAEIGAEHYVVHSGLTYARQAEAIEAAYGRQREWLARSGDLARARGVVICVETLFADERGYATAPSRLARELSAIAHPNVLATIDFSHSYLKLDYDGRRDDFLSEMKALAPFARHLHIHDSFGRQDDIWTYTNGEKLAYGHGDLHLPVGWGDIPWDAILAECTFPAGVLFNIELDKRYWYAAQECVDATRALAARASVSSAAAAA